MSSVRHLRSLLSAALVAALAFISGCATFGLQLEQQTNAHKLRAAPKAFAVGYYPNGTWVAGWSYSQPSLEKAKEVALRGCEEQGAKRGAPITCRILYENDTFVSQTTSTAAPQTPRPPATAQPAPQAGPIAGTGSGVFISADGTVLTAEHVIHGATNIEILTQDGRRLQARVTSASRSLDLAVLFTGAPADAFLPVRLSRPTPGARIFTVGYPLPGVLGQEPKVSDGIINAVSGIRDDAGFMQISIPIQPGNSGGPVVTEDGSLVGVVTSSAAIAPFLERTGTIPQNVNWAVHSSLAVTLLGAEGAKVPGKTRKQSISHTIRASVLVFTQTR